MAQSDLTIENQSFPSFRTDLNNALSALNTTQSGTSRPSSAVAGTTWLDTTSATTPTLKFFDGTDDISLGVLDYSANTITYTLADGSITTAKILDDNITTAKILDSNVTTAKIADANITLAKLSATGTKDSTTFLRGDNTFAAAAAGGKLLQVTYATYSTEKTFNSATYISLDLVGTITPSSTSSKIYVLISAQGTCDNNDNIQMKIDRNGTSVYATNGYFMSNQAGTVRSNFPLMALDSPNSTSERTYTLYGLSTGGNTVQTNEAGSPTSITLMEIAG